MDDSRPHATSVKGLAADDCPDGDITAGLPILSLPKSRLRIAKPSDGKMEKGLSSARNNPGSYAGKDITANLPCFALFKSLPQA